MGNIYLGVNMEFVRSADKPFEWGVEKAAELGYQYVEPMVHWGRELLSEAGYFHSVSLLESHPSGMPKGGHPALRPLGPCPADQAGDRHRVPEAGGPLCRGMRRPGRQYR
jgi:hypothetical protein